MKILVLTNNDTGLYKFRKELLKEFIDRGDDVYISLPDGDFICDLTRMGCKFIKTKVDRRGLNPIRELTLLLFYQKIIRQIAPDIVITYTIKPNLYGGAVCRFNGKCYYANITGLGSAFYQKGFLKVIIKLLYRSGLKKAQKVFFENVDNLKAFTDQKIIKVSQAFILNGAGVNLSDYSYCPYPREDEVVRFLFIGRVMKEKGIEEFLQAAIKAKQQYPNTEFGILGWLEEEYKDQIQCLEKTNTVKYYGFVKDVKPYIQSCHCVVLPSYHEGMSNTLLESAAMGRPLITSDIAGCKEAVLDNQSGFLCKAKSVEDLCEKIANFVRLRYEEKVSMSVKAREHMETEFDKKKIVDTTLMEILK